MPEHDALSEDCWCNPHYEHLCQDCNGSSCEKCNDEGWVKCDGKCPGVDHLMVHPEGDDEHSYGPAPQP